MTESSWFEFQFRNGTDDFRVDETKMCRIPKFSEAWDIDDCVDLEAVPKFQRIHSQNFRPTME
jgi:hypothetical protein